MTTCRIVTGGSDGRMRTGLNREPAPALMVSVVYLKQFLKLKDELIYRDWALDSGAYSIKKQHHASRNGEVSVDLNEYIDLCHQLDDEHPRLREIFALDVIGDAEQSLKNVEEMWRQGVMAVPAFHMGSEWRYLLELSKRVDEVGVGKIGIGGMMGTRSVRLRSQFVKQCFARVWPKRLHGFAIGSRKRVLELPWHSVDASNWQQRPARYGLWDYLNDRQVTLPGGDLRTDRVDIRAQVAHYMNIEREARERWATELALLDDQKGEKK